MSNKGRKTTNLLISPDMKTEMDHWRLYGTSAQERVGQLEVNPTTPSGSHVDYALERNNAEFNMCVAQLGEIMSLPMDRATPEINSFLIRIGAELQSGRSEYSRRYAKCYNPVSIMRKHTDSHRRALRFLFVKRWEVLSRRASNHDKDEHASKQSTEFDDDDVDIEEVLAAELDAERRHRKRRENDACTQRINALKSVADMPIPMELRAQHVASLYGEKAAVKLYGEALLRGDND